jgi:phosphoserine phosphatase RsbU/P
MRILVADEDDISRLALEAVLAGHGHEVVAVADGQQAWQAVQASDAPKITILDSVSPRLCAIDICRRIRQQQTLQAIYVVLLTVRDNRAHNREALEAGADDYVSKPFDADELQVRVNVGVKVVQLRSELAQRVTQLEEARARVQHLQGLLPICSYCKSIRDDNDYWHRVEKYIGAHSDVQFTHGICPDCWKNVVAPQLEEMGIQVPEQPNLFKD